MPEEATLGVPGDHSFSFLPASVCPGGCLPLECNFNVFQEHTAALQYVAFTQAFQSQLQTALPAAGYSGKPVGRRILCTMVLRLYLEGCLGQAKDPPQTLRTLFFFGPRKHHLVVFHISSLS